MLLRKRNVRKTASPYCNFKKGNVFPLVESGNFPSHFSTAFS